MPQLGLNHASTAIATKGMNQLAISPTAFHPPGSMIVSPTANRPKNEESHIAMTTIGRSGCRSVHLDHLPPVTSEPPHGFSVTSITGERTGAEGRTGLGR